MIVWIVIFIVQKIADSLQVILTAYALTWLAAKIVKRAIRRNIYEVKPEQHL